MSRFAFYALFYTLLMVISLPPSTGHASGIDDAYVKLKDLQNQKRYDEAIKLAEQQLEILKMTLGAKHPEVGRMLNRLAEFNNLNGSTKHAVDLYHKVLIDFASVKGEHRSVIRNALGNLTLLYMSVGQFSNAEKYAQIMKKEVGLAAQTDGAQQKSHAPKSTVNTAKPNSTAFYDFSAVAQEKNSQPVEKTQLSQQRNNATAPSEIKKSAQFLNKPQLKSSRTGISEKIAIHADYSKVPKPLSVCPKPVINTEAADGGTLNIRVVSNCLAGKTYNISYGKLRFLYRLSASGTDQRKLDLFAGTQTRIAIEFNGQKPVVISPPKTALKNIVKVAVVWKKPVDLDIHAFEYAAEVGQEGHIWSGASRTLTQAKHIAQTKKRAHGYISQSSAGKDGLGTNVEVYTLIKHPEQRYGAVSLALVFKSRESQARPPFCGANALASVPFEIYRLQADGVLEIEAGLIPSMRCGKSIGRNENFLLSAISDINLRQH